MSVRQLIPSLGAELDELCARLSCVEELLGVGVLSRENSNADESCRICGITWQLGAGPDEYPLPDPDFFFPTRTGPGIFFLRISGFRVAALQVINWHKYK